MLGQVGIWFAVALSALLGLGIVGAIAAGPQPAPTVAATTTSAATTISATTTTTVGTTVATTIPSTTVAVTTVPVTTLAQIVPTAGLPVAAPTIVMTAEIVDGDTITMSDGSKVRLIGIDTPERGQCGYEEASAKLAQLIVGQSITLVPGARDDVDKYGRLLRYVETNGVDVNLKMIESGRAIARYDGRDGYGVHPRQDAYVQADGLSPSLNICGAVPVVVPVPSVPAAAPPPSVFYQNCAAVRAAGAAPIRPGDPGWQTKFDGDGDGVGCE
jgi:endonuclease YncB( thermonuclease family)